ncbi:glucohydrolase [Aerococcus urinaehominis]|uniref:Alpha,alpha-phosphotrehalase n=1 Tax=Aerococcus urinaehominis TaxID=128944 RepID=A0A0X8FMC8_9LACT|nr:alpha,alpha-phosphotrehalase [Aerococcus urinaehominis]AMB99958.1 glucohydrolase [Aerococcus urinaehominis]SDM44529.1 trehalose-6-phosphate hydrolase [Aerococcus urinaehominis]
MTKALGQYVIYQVYPKSFKDSDGDGHGDLRGVIEKLDYLAQLGIDMIWLNPFYPSPQKDNGYDISDYTAIDPRYGTMTDFEDLVDQAGQRGIGLMLDMPLNHSSIDHDWFQAALSGDEYYQDYYYIRPAKADGSLPTNWASKFGGPAWAPFAGEEGEYYLHLYDRTQADLNWHNPAVRHDLYDILRFWLAKGVKGFRFDVMNVIGKDEVLVDSTGGPGSSQEKRLYTDTENAHRWVHEMNRASFGQNPDIITVGEMSSTTIADGIRYTQPDQEKLDMIFSFHHLKVDYQDGDKWTTMPFDFMALKQILNDWQRGMAAGQGWNALFFNNHDQPRANSRFGDPDNYPYETATMLAQTIHLMRGTPYIFQGEEIGMTNPGFDHLADYRDVESLNYYQILRDQGLDDRQAMAIIKEKSRDNSRTPMQWDDSDQAGFTTGQPWIKLADNYERINVAREVAQGKIFPYYQALIKLRHDLEIIQLGDYEGLLLDHPQVLAYRRRLDDQELVVFSHFYPGQAEVNLNQTDLNLNQAWTKLIGNGELNELTSQFQLGPYETVAFISGGPAVGS